MAPEPIAVGIVGAGRNTKARHIPGLQAIEGVEIVSVCNRTRESSQHVADGFGIAKVYEDWRELVSASDTNAIVVGTWPYMHRDVTCAALDAGKHVMCEARMAMNAVEAHAMLQVSRNHPDLVAQLVPAPLTLRVDRSVEELLADRRLGDVHTITIRSISRAFPSRETPLSWRHQRRYCGNNVLDLGIWYETAMRWVGEATRVQARCRTVVRHHRDLETGALVDVDVPDHVDVIADLKDGAVATYHLSAVGGLGPRSGIWLFGSHGTLHYDLDGDRLLLGKAGDSALREAAIPATAAGKWRVEEEFVNAIRGLEEVTLTKFEDGVKYMEFTDAVHSSSESGQALSLPLDGRSG